MLQVAKNQTQPRSLVSGLVEPLTREDQLDVLGFLSTRPEHTFVMAGCILDNGLVSPLNRGTFYGYRNAQRELEGVALIGHITVFETRSDAALAVFARLTQDCSSVHSVMGETEKVSRFLSLFTETGRKPRLLRRELLFRQRRRENCAESVSGLRLAAVADLSLVAPVHAQMAFEESGVDPLFQDPEGFYRRCTRRIEQGRVWIKTENNQLIFKADVISETPEVIYLEGVYVGVKVRGKGFGARCLKQLTNELLTVTKSVCLLVNECNSRAFSCYEKAGYHVCDRYDTLYFAATQVPSLH